MALPRKPHSFVLGGVTCRGECQPFTPRRDETPFEEALTIKGYWLIFADTQPSSMIVDAAITNIVLVATGQVIEEGPVYIRQIKPYFSGISTDHVELLCAAYRGES